MIGALVGGVLASVGLQRNQTYAAEWIISTIYDAAGRHGQAAVLDRVGRELVQHELRVRAAAGRSATCSPATTTRSGSVER